MRDLKLALSLIAKDTGSKALRQALSGIQQQTTANKKAEDEAARSREQSAQSGIRAARSLQQNINARPAHVPLWAFDLSVRFSERLPRRRPPTTVCCVPAR